jgi:Erythromycin esterase
MWRNAEMRDFVGWLAEHNARTSPDPRAGFFGLDLYSLSSSVAAGIDYFERVDPEAARLARDHYACLEPWQQNPAAYGRASLSAGFGPCEAKVLSILQELLARRLDYAHRDGDSFLDAAQLLQIGDELVELGIVDNLFVEGGHGTEAVTDLVADEKAGQRLVADRRPEARGTAGVAFLAIAHEHDLPGLRRRTQAGRRVERLAPPCRPAAADHDGQQRRSESSCRSMPTRHGIASLPPAGVAAEGEFDRTMRHSAPVSGQGFEPRPDMLSTPKSTT